MAQAAKPVKAYSNQLVLAGLLKSTAISWYWSDNEISGDYEISSDYLLAHYKQAIGGHGHVGMDVTKFSHRKYNRGREYERVNGCSAESITRQMKRSSLLSRIAPPVL